MTTNSLDILDISFIEKTLNLKNDELVVLGGRPSMGKTSFALNMLNNSSKRGCFIELWESPEEISSKEEKMKIKDSQKNYETICMERPSLIELIELIVDQKDKVDYFVIDDMSGLNEAINPLFSKDKNYQFVLRYLKLIAKGLKKNIFLFSQLSRIVENGNFFNFIYYAIREKYIDHILTILRPAYYVIEVDPNTGLEFERNAAFLFVAKTKLRKNSGKINMKFDYPIWSLAESESFVENRLLD